MGCSLTRRFIRDVGCCHKTLHKNLWEEIQRDAALCKKTVSLEKRVECELKVLLARLLWYKQFAPEKKEKKIELERLEQLAGLPWSRSSPFLRTLFALTNHLLQLPDLELGFVALPCGAIPLSLGEYQPFSWIPYQPEHIQLGAFLLLLGMVKRQNTLLESAIALASWQQKLLCFNATPAWGVFARLGVDSRLERRALYQLLREGTAKCGVVHKEGDEDLSGEPGRLSPLWVLIENAFHAYSADEKTAFHPLQEQSWDTSCGIWHVKTEKEANYLTLHGGKTGLGAMHTEKIELVTYGPSYAPFGAEDGFGIEANSSSQQGMKKVFFHQERDKIYLKSCVRMVDQPSREPGGMARFRGIWLEVSQAWKHPLLQIDTRVLSLEGWEDVGMRFLIRADRAWEENNITGSFLSFQSGKEKLCLQSLHPQGVWKLQPLEKCDLYWGANWQAISVFTNAQTHYSWQVSCSGG